MVIEGKNKSELTILIKYLKFDLSLEIEVRSQFRS